MRPPIRGRLISSSFATDVFPTSPLFVSPPVSVRHLMERCGDQIAEGLGRASSVRQVTKISVIPMLRVLGLRPPARHDTPSLCQVHTGHGAAAGPLVLVTPYGDSLDAAWRSAVHGAIANDVRWCLCCNGQHLRVVDGRRTWSRAYLEFDLSATLENPDGQALLWSLLRADAIASRIPALEQAVEDSARHGANVCRSLGRGVLE